MITCQVYMQSTSTPVPPVATAGPGQIGSAGEQLTNVAYADPPSACCTTTLGAMPSPDVLSLARTVIVTVWPIPPTCPAGSGVIEVTLNVGATRSSTTVTVTGVWLTAGEPMLAQQ